MHCVMIIVISKNKVARKKNEKNARFKNAHYVIILCCYLYQHGLLLNCYFFLITEADRLFLHAKCRNILSEIKCGLEQYCG